ncbi:legume lectin, alpha chain, conserved site [Artemisia annua]|uniref:Legume lectin, alpha chain, conserved site n=1 Tax=Artemisia annua TaxID=35608 RepID=A0A2U1QDU2_ARTAN|nr:legume lectin, alpha chain, conserved site [Artemisia annua]
MDSSSPPQNYISFMLFVFCFLFFLPLSKPVDFEITSFSTDATNILYSGDVATSFGDIQLNVINHQIRVGHAIYADPIQIWDSKSGKLSDFTTHFTFVIDTLGDPPYKHVDINLNSIRLVNYTAWNASLHSGKSADAWLSYNATSHMLILNWRYAYGLSYKVDLRELLSEWVTIGFSGTTGVAVERHNVQYWEFSSSLNSMVLNREGKSNKWKLAVGLIAPGSSVSYPGRLQLEHQVWNEDRRRRPTWRLRRPRCHTTKPSLFFAVGLQTVCTTSYVHQSSVCLMLAGTLLTRYLLDCCYDARSEAVSHILSFFVSLPSGCTSRKGTRRANSLREAHFQPCGKLQQNEKKIPSGTILP